MPHTNRALEPDVTAPLDSQLWDAITAAEALSPLDWAEIDRIMQDDGWQPSELTNTFPDTEAQLADRYFSLAGREGEA